MFRFYYVTQLLLPLIRFNVVMFILTPTSNLFQSYYVYNAFHASYNFNQVAIALGKYNTWARTNNMRVTDTKAKVVSTDDNMKEVVSRV